MRESQSDDLVLVAAYEALSEAEVAASLLRAEGIDTLVDRPFVAGVRPNWPFGRKERRKGVLLFVRCEDAVVAREILEAGLDGEGGDRG